MNSAIGQLRKNYYGMRMQEESTKQTKRKSERASPGFRQTKVWGGEPGESGLGKSREGEFV
jgi:hypothetical protein